MVGRIAALAAAAAVLGALAAFWRRLAARDAELRAWLDDDDWPLFVDVDGGL